MLSKVQHRGPDGSGIFEYAGVGIGQSRLSIIDVEGGQQPMSDSTNSYWITYNGELYNYQELRVQLRLKGFAFKTNSDTEVVLQAYACWGKECVSFFRGMFAFCILDTIRKELFLARDQFGIKPLVYATGPDLFAFASEIQALRPVSGMDWEINLTGIDQFLSYQYIPAPYSIFNGVKKLLPGHFMRVDFAGSILEVTQYWDIDFASDSTKSQAYWLESIEQAISDSVQAHLVSDVPFGAFLSGGVDSSLVVSQMAKKMKSPLKTFCIGFEEKDFSEIEFARKVAVKYGTDHHEEIVKPRALEILPDLVKHYGEPFGDSSAIPTYYVSKLARKEVTMVLSGDGGDELFGGYENYTTRWIKHFSPIPEHLPIYKKAVYFGMNKIIPEKYPLRTASLTDWKRYIEYFNQQHRSHLWKKEFQEQFAGSDDFIKDVWLQAKQYSHFHKTQYTDFKTYLPYAVLTKVDIASMMHSLEVRTPLLDVEVIKLASQIPEKFNTHKINGDWVGKDILKRILTKEMGENFAYRKKMGFGVPLNHWFGDSNKVQGEIQERILSRGNLLENYFQRTELEKIAFGSQSGKQWLLIFLQEWLTQNT
ncbi:asparagine synthase (glutamine-hydrolyzing) [Algoriphagus ratkowskyi]|nr:asparagine synthase (glutamine-hydrolyzing) [Algoriphagus ratkowskyi]